METKSRAEDTVDERRFARVPFLGRVRFVYGAGRQGTGSAADVGRGGLRVHMGRYLRPGTKLMVSIPLDGPDQRSVELKTEVVWCRREAGRLEFETGLRAYYDAPEALEAISEVMYYALFEKGALANGRRIAVTGRPLTIRGMDVSANRIQTACGLTC